MLKKQKGFALLETTLILVILIVISGVAWYALHTKHQTDRILSQADKISQTTPVSTKSNASKGSSSSSTTSAQYLVIKEWGVKIPLSSAISDAYYAVYPESIYGANTDVGLSLDSLKNTGCDVNHSPPAAYYRVRSDSSVKIPSDAVKIGDYNYFTNGASVGVGTCTSDESLSQKASAASTAFDAALKNLSPSN